jgi:hypothetical protein
MELVISPHRLHETHHGDLLHDPGLMIPARIAAVDIINY